jgi:hypothetical protein
MEAQPLRYGPEGISARRQRPLEAYLNYEGLELPTITEKLVDYPEPPEPMREFVTDTYPEIGEAVSELSGRELSVLTFCLLEAYHDRGQRHCRRTAHYRTVKAYLGLHDPPEPPGKFHREVETSLERVRETIREYNRPQYAVALLDKVRTAVQSGSLDSKFHVAPGSQEPGPGETSGQYVSQRWLESRGSYARVLFGDRKDILKLPEEEPAPKTPFYLAKLALDAGQTRATKQETITRANIAKGVEAVLTRHQAASRTETQPAIFGLRDPEKDLGRIVVMTSRVISMWESAWNRPETMSDTDSDRQWPFAKLSDHTINPGDLSDPTVHLVIEAAAATIETLGITRRKYSANLIARHGPAFAQAFVSGELIRSFCEQRGHDSAKWLKFFSQHERTTLACYYNDPFGRLEDIITQMNTNLSDPGLAALTGWPAKKASAVFTPIIRFQIASKHAPHKIPKIIPMAAKKLETELSTNFLAQRWGWQPERVDKAFPLSKRIRIILDHKVPLDFFDKAARELDDPIFDHQHLGKELGWSERKVAQLFTFGVLRDIAQKGGGLEEVRRIATNYDLLSTPYLMQELGLSKQEAIDYFLDASRKRLAQRQKPLQGAREIVRVIRTLSSEYTLPERLVVRIASLHTLKGARALAELVQTQQMNRPYGVAESHWATIVAARPQFDVAGWEKRAAAELSQLRTIGSMRSARRLDNSTSLASYAYVANQNAADPADVVAEKESGSDEFDRLKELADQVGLSAGQLETLLDAFADGSSPEEIQDPGLAAMLQSLQEAAGSS